MPRNVYFSQGTASEQNLYEDITIEALKIYGHEAFYIPRKIVNEDGIFNEDKLSEFGSSYNIEAYVANVDGYEGDGELLSKFGLEIRDQLTLIISNRRWEQLIGRHIQSDTNLDRKVVRRPMEGDLIYLPTVKGLFEIKFVETEDPFYQLQNLPVFQLKCEIFEYGGEAIDTGIEDIDGYETDFATRIQLTMGSGSGTYQIGEDIEQTIPGIGGSGTRKITGEAATWDSPNLKLEVYGISGFNNSPDTTFVAGGNPVIGLTSGASYTISITNNDSPTLDNFERMKDTDKFADNKEFEDVGNNFIDFSISNPFGLPNA